MEDMRCKLKNNGINGTWLARMLTEKTGKKIFQSRLQVVLRGGSDSIGSYYIREIVTDYLNELEKFNRDYFAKKIKGD